MERHIENITRGQWLFASNECSTGGEVFRFPFHSFSRGLDGNRAFMSDSRISAFFFAHVSPFEKELSIRFFFLSPVDAVVFEGVLEGLNRFQTTKANGKMARKNPQATGKPIGVTAKV